MDTSIISTPIFEQSQEIFMPAVLPVREPETWAELVNIEPALFSVESFVQSLRGRRDCRQWEQVKRRFSCLVGWNARKSALQSSRCFDIAYHHLLSIFEAKRRRASR